MSASNHSSTTIITGNYNRRIQRSAWLNRWALAVVYTWFGFLKIIWKSPAEQLITSLFERTLKPVMSLQVFLPSFGILECLIGIAWLFPRFTRMAYWAMVVHMIATFLPVFLLPNITWQSFMTLTLVGQYIFKNLVMLAAGTFVYTLARSSKAQERPLKKAENPVFETIGI